MGLTFPICTWFQQLPVLLVGMGKANRSRRTDVSILTKSVHCPFLCHAAPSCLLPAQGRKKSQILISELLPFPRTSGRGRNWGCAGGEVWLLSGSPPQGEFGSPHAPKQGEGCACFSIPVPPFLNSSSQAFRDHHPPDHLCQLCRPGHLPAHARG